MKLAKRMILPIWVMLLSFVCSAGTFYAAENHVCEYDEGVIIQEATCAIGYKKHTCKICGKEDIRSYDGNGQHVYVIDMVMKEPTCSSTGMTRYRCTGCSHSFKKTIDKLPHQKDGGTVVKEPTANESGLKEYRCTVCNEIAETEIIPAVTDSADGWLKVDGIWYYYQNGTKLCGQWILSNGNWYYLTESGQMATGWLKDGSNWYYLKEDGAMLTNAWLNDGAWYYLGGSGAMLTNAWLLDNGNWYYLNANGTMTTGWVESNSNWYYMGKDGTMLTNKWILDGAWYYLGEDGVMLSEEWLLDNGNWYYLRNGGQMAIGWLSYNSNWYYLDAGGRMLNNEWLKEKNKWYYLGKSGTMLSSEWLLDNGSWYYLEASGVMAARQWIGDYYLTASGAMAKNQWVENNFYYIGEDGLVEHGMYQIDMGNGQYKTVYGEFNTAFENEVIRLVNEYRIENGLEPFKASDFLSKKTDIRGAELTQNYSHDRPNGESCSTVFYDGGCIFTGENIAVSYPTPQQVFDAWKNSPGHNANMLKENSRGRYIGVSCFISKDSAYRIHWVQMFASDTK